MKKSQIGTAIIWSIGLLFLTGFLYVGSFHTEWNWGILFFVVAFWGWGLQRSFGRKESPGRKELPPHPVVRFIRHTVAATVSGFAFYFLAIFVLMCLGTERHDNYEHYGQYPVLYVTPALVGFFLPTLLVWIFGKVKSQKDK